MGKSAPLARRDLRVASLRAIREGIDQDGVLPRPDIDVHAESVGHQAAKRVVRGDHDDLEDLHVPEPRRRSAAIWSGVALLGVTARTST